MGSFACPLCCKHDFLSVVALHEHLLYYVYRPLQCVICSAHVGGIQELTHHLERHLGDGISSALSQPNLLPDQPNGCTSNIAPRTDYGNSSANPENLNFYGSTDNRHWKKWNDGSVFMSPGSREEPIELTLRAYFCHTCGAKIVGKDAYFIHIKEHTSRPSSYVPNAPSSVNSSSQLEVSSPVWNDVGPSSPKVASACSTPINITTDSETVTSEDTRETTLSPEPQISDCIEESHSANQLLKLREWQLGKHGRRFKKHRLAFSNSSRVSNQSPMSDKVLYSTSSPSTIIDPGSVERSLPDHTSGFESRDGGALVLENTEAPPSVQAPTEPTCLSMETATTEIEMENSVPSAISKLNNEVIGMSEDERCNMRVTEEVIHENVTQCTSFSDDHALIDLHADEEDIPLDDCMVSALVNDCFTGSPSFQSPHSTLAPTVMPSSSDSIADKTDSSVFISYSWISPHHPVQLLELETVTKTATESEVNNDSQNTFHSFAKPPSQEGYVSSETQPFSSDVQISQEYAEDVTAYNIPEPLDSTSEAVIATKFAEYEQQEPSAANYECNYLHGNISRKGESSELDISSNIGEQNQKSRNEVICPQRLPVVSDCSSIQNLASDIDNNEPQQSSYMDACAEADDVSSDTSDKARSSANSCEEHSDITRPYLHKKFHHDQERKGVARVGIGQSADVNRYIQSFQSLLVSKLNGTLSTNLPFKDTRVCTTADKPKKQIAKNVSDEGAVIRQSLPSEYICEVCDLKFTNRPAYKAHYKLHEVEGQNNFKCQYCEKVFYRKSSKDLHLRTHTGEKTHRCDLCPQVFTKLYSYQRHQNEVHAIMKSFICAECSKGFSSQRQLEDHICVHQSEKLHKCHYCNHSCQTASGLRTHKMEAHSGKQEKEHQCKLCGEHFKKQSGLKRHILRKHSMQKIKCDMCPKVYSCNEDLLQHRKTHNTEPLRCHHCAKTFTSSWNLQRHAVTHNSTTHPHKCSIGTCRLTFTRLDSLNCHMKIHAQKKPHICHCGKRFVKKSHLKDHEDKHSEIPKHACNICNRAFKFKVSLKNHSCKISPDADRKQQIDTSN